MLASTLPRFVAIAALAIAAHGARGQEMPLIQEIGPDTFSVGEVQLNKQLKTVTIPATVNMREGPLEYLLVGETGKTHESLLSSKVEPYHIHVAMLLIGARDTSSQAPPPPGRIDAEYLKKAPELQGDNVTVTLVWQRDGAEERTPANEWVLNHAEKAPMTAGPWRYTGSGLSNGTFRAQVEGSMIALITDPAALINNPRPGRDDDRIWTARKEKIPPLETPLSVIITLQAQKPSP